VDFIMLSQPFLRQPDSGEPVFWITFEPGTSQKQCYTRLLGAVLMIRITAFCIMPG